MVAVERARSRPTGVQVVEFTVPLLSFGLLTATLLVLCYHVRFTFQLVPRPLIDAENKDDERGKYLCGEEVLSSLLLSALGTGLLFRALCRRTLPILVSQGRRTLTTGKWRPMRLQTVFLLILLLILGALLNVAYLISNMHSSVELSELDLTNMDKHKLLSTVADLHSQVKILKERNGNLELRMNSWMNWNSDPYLGSNANPKLCHNMSKLDEYGCAKGKNQCPGFFSHRVCLDQLLPQKAGKCIIYDFGIRENPHFGETLSNPPFNCQVFAFDPSPITDKWYKGDAANAKALRAKPNYKLFHYGAGGVNGNVKLSEYDWGQVSIVRYPINVAQGCANNTKQTNCDFGPKGGQKRFSLPVRTLGSIMKELGHDHVDILKLDVEGSEYMFLEEAIEDGSLEHVEQLTLEWHHYEFDSRYGGGSTPSINTIMAFLNKIGLQQFFIHDDYGGWPSQGRDFWKRGLTLRYNLCSLLRVRR